MIGALPLIGSMPGVGDVPHIGTMPCGSGMPKGSSMPKNSSMPKDSSMQGGSNMPKSSSTPGADTVDVRRMLQIGLTVCQVLALFICHVVALCRRIGNIPKSRQYTEVGHSMTTSMCQVFGLIMAMPMSRCLVLP